MPQPCPAHGLFDGVESPSRELLEQWLDEHGVKRSRGLSVEDMDVEDGHGWRLVAKRDYDMGQILCQIPKNCLLSMRTSSLQPLLPPSALQPHTSHTILYLALALLHELRLREQSHFWGYIQSLPRETIQLPVFWQVEEIAGEDGKLAREWLRGTEAERDLLRKDAEGLSLDDLRTFYYTLAPHLPPTAAHPKPSPFLAYLHTYSLICTRAFQIDLYHTVALCPFADLLNHSSSAPHTSLSVDDFVCHLCGSLAPCTHDVQSTSGVVRRLEHLRDEERRKLEKGDDVDTVDLLVDKSPVRAGEEVMNCYGEGMGDGRLLVEWGFIEDDSTGLHLDFDLEDLKVDDSVLPTWMRLWESRRLQTMVSQTQDEKEDEDRLIGLPRPERPMSLELDANGSLSINAIALIALSLRPEGAPESNAEEAIRATIVEVERLWSSVLEDQEREGDAVQTTSKDEPRTPGISSSTRRVVEKVVDMLNARLGRMYRPDASLDELFEIRDLLPNDAQLQRMAITLVINERSLLDSTKQKWTDVLEMLGSPKAWGGAL